MSEREMEQVITAWQTERQTTEAALAKVFVRHAIDNRGIMTSTRRAGAVSTQLLDRVFGFMTGDAEEPDISALAVQFAEQGMAFVTAARLMHTLTEIGCAYLVDTPHEVHAAYLKRLSSFEMFFLEHLANARELIQQRIQENSQLALQRALQKQLEQQQALHQAQTKRNQDLNHILQLNAQLALITDEQLLLQEAVNGICAALELDHVAIYEQQPPADWLLRTASIQKTHEEWHMPATLQALTAALTAPDGFFQAQSPRANHTAVTLPLQVGGEILGAMHTAVHITAAADKESFLIQIRAFAQNLSALWHNLYLYAQTEERARELEILHGRFMDSLWGETSDTVVEASMDQQKLSIHRGSRALPPAASPHALPLEVGDQAFGHVQLPTGAHLEDEDLEFIRAIVREMSSALNTTHLLQTTRAYANQLSVAAEVSRAAATILERDKLIAEVVELIRARFGFYYVGLFLLDKSKEKAVLQAGTGEAGRIQVSRNHAHVVGGGSMIGAAVADGQPRVEQDVSKATAFMRNPLLPETRSELALPLHARGEVIGALTVQSTHTGAFTQTAVTVLQSLADQLAIAIENASLLAQTRRNLAESHQLYEYGRRISAADNAEAIQQILVDFAQESELVDLAAILVEDPTDPDYLIIPSLWSETDIHYNPHHQYLRDKYIFSDQLSEQECILLPQQNDAVTFDRYTRRLLAQFQPFTAALISIRQEDEWLGTLALLRHSDKPFTMAEIQPFLSLTRQAAIILANYQLLNQSESLYRFGRAMTQAITRDDALAIAVEEVARFTGASQCRLVLYEQRTGSSYVVAAYDENGIVENIHLPMLGDYVYEHLRRDRKPLLLGADDPDIPQETRQRHVKQFGAKASLLIPAGNQKALMGFMAIDAVRGKRPFKPANIRYAQTVVSHLATQIENINLLDEALNRAQEMITLNQIQSNISVALELDRLARTVYDQIGRLLDNEIFLLGQFDANTHEYRPLLNVYAGQVIVAPPRTLTEDDPLFKFLQRKTHLVADSQHPLMGCEPALQIDEPPAMGLWMPLLQEDVPNGVLAIQSHNPHAYDDNDIQLLRSIATQTSLAFANAQLFAAIQASNKKLRQLDHMKTQFLANMSHELRTPLNSIIGFSRVILKGIDGPITPEQEEDLTSIHSNGQHLLMLINEILDMAKIEAGKMNMVFAEVDLLASAKAAYTAVTSLIRQDVDFIWDLPAQLPAIEADPIRIRQILINLFSNAAKYTTQGTIQLSIRAYPKFIEISVKDTGIGIAEEDFDKLFAAFEQVDNSTTRTVSGTGLGLPITKWLVSMHNGRIWFESQVNIGSTFYVQLPIQQPQSQNGAQAASLTA